MLISNIKSDFTFENFKNFVVRKHKFRKSQVLLNNLFAMVTPEILGNQKYFMLHRLISNVTKFQFLAPKRFSTVVKNIFFGGGGASLRVNALKSISSSNVHSLKENMILKVIFGCVAPCGMVCWICRKHSNDFVRQVETPGKSTISVGRQVYFVN